MPFFGPQTDQEWLASYWPVCEKEECFACGGAGKSQWDGPLFCDVCGGKGFRWRERLERVEH